MAQGHNNDPRNGDNNGGFQTPPPIGDANHGNGDPFQTPPHQGVQAPNNPPPIQPANNQHPGGNGFAQQLNFDDINIETPDLVGYDSDDDEDPFDVPGNQLNNANQDPNQGLFGPGMF